MYYSIQWSLGLLNYERMSFAQPCLNLPRVWLDFDLGSDWAILNQWYPYEVIVWWLKFVFTVIIQLEGEMLLYFQLIKLVLHVLYYWNMKLSSWRETTPKSDAVTFILHSRYDVHWMMNCPIFAKKKKKAFFYLFILTKKKKKFKNYAPKVLPWFDQTTIHLLLLWCVLLLCIS